ncbi:hypothetical protein JYU14_03390 [Simkania negevensis]|uniref:NlpC/P60 domain-containing protein n=1 Tax=Simkania negevensis TaxID=83561 RepID=A0ABS3ARU7_9BACT|nr:hypothetical protein [Simkania negevensis]
MSQRLLSYSLLSLILFCLPLSLHGKKLDTPLRSVVVVPVADLVFSPMQKARAGVDVKKAYNELPLSRGSTSKPALRAHQVLFNELVYIWEEEGPEVRVELANVFFTPHGEKSRHSLFWTLKSNVIPVETLEKRGITTSLLPSPVNYRHPKSIEAAKNVIVLQLPFQEKESGRVFSVGTRFVSTGYSDNKKSYFVAVLDPSAEKMMTMAIPQEQCIVHRHRTHEEKIHHFVALLKSWSNRQTGYIPYVLGGKSWTRLEQNRGSIEGKAGVKTGFDCSSIILAAAQVCEIPYFYMNTTTAAKYLEPLKKGESIREGDLIIYPGHVLVVSDLRKNRILEARGYSSGFGKVHELPISEVFGGITSYRSLVNAYHTNKSFLRLDEGGGGEKKIHAFTIYKIRSAFHPHLITKKR